MTPTSPAQFIFNSNKVDSREGVRMLFYLRCHSVGWLNYLKKRGSSKTMEFNSLDHFEYILNKMYWRPKLDLEAKIWLRIKDLLPAKSICLDLNTSFI